MNKWEGRKSRGLEQGDIKVSFEFFPPKSDKMEQRLWQAISKLAPLDPQFVSVTYGAGGSTRTRTHATVSRILQETNLLPAAHLTCVGATKDEVNEVINDYKSVGVKHIVALRGDPVEGVGETYQPHPDGYQSSIELIEGISNIGGFDILVSAYPEQHPESPNRAADIDWLKRKVDAGATTAITQFFFDNEFFLRYLDDVRAAGINIPITPGIIPIANFQQVRKFADMTGASIPNWLAHRFDGLENEDEDTRQMVAAAIGAEQVMELVDEGIKEFHFYTLNKAKLVYAICHLLGLRSSSVLSNASSVLSNEGAQA
ncbi:MAG: methylenetetrahydrofolate reductase [NAD(P)H] [Hyphomicrobiaceae bacterium]|nr:methylenetetrahydrofolate reductase [NAD(P)H] [Hyphomicrobiaceae bacterium]